MRNLVRGVALLASIAIAMTLVAAPASAADEIVPGTVSVTGRVQYEQTLVATTAGWPADVVLSYQWLRDGLPVGSDATANSTRRLSNLKDVGRSFSVRVTATRAGSSPVSVTSPATGPVAQGALAFTARPRITGRAQYAKKLTGHVGRTSRGADARVYRWLRDGRPIGGATGRHYRVRSADVGHTITFRVTARRAGFSSVQAVSRGVRAGQRSVREVVTYSVRTRGAITADVATFKRLAQQTYDDPRGWRAMGIRFKRVASGGDFTLWLSQASKVPSFSSACSATYSCRVGRNVVINQTRWQHATTVWDDEGGSLRDYRHMVVNHETGHWFGRGHVGCGGKGQLAPVMQQQSKGLAGCDINPWPKKNELHAPRYGF